MDTYNTSLPRGQGTLTLYGLVKQDTMGEMTSLQRIFKITIRAKKKPVIPKR